MNASDNLEKHENIEPIEEPLDGGNGENLNTLSPDIK